MDQGDNHYASASNPMKRKRGRPRKYPNFQNVQNTQPQRDPDLSKWKKVDLQESQTVYHGENASVPPGFESPKGNQPWKGNHVQGANDIKVGQVVSGVVEAVFDAGCLLTVRVGNSLTTLRGVVFRPGHYVPVSTENDVAPDVQMIKRTDIPLPTVSSAQMQGHNSQVKEKNSPLASLLGSGTVSPLSNLSSAGVPKITIPDANPSTSRNEQAPSFTQAANLISTGGNMVPIAIQSAYFSNGVLVSNQPSPVVSRTVPPTTSGNQDALSSHPSNVSATNNQLTASDIVTGSQTQPSDKKMMEGKPKEMDLFNHSVGAQNNKEDNSTKSPVMSFQNLLTEVMKSAEPPSQGVHPQTVVSMPIDKSQALQSGNTHEHEARVPLQTVESTHHNNSAAVPNSTSSHDKGNNKMSELLRVLQDNFDDNQRT